MENCKPSFKKYLGITLLLLGLSSSLSAYTNPLLSPSDSILETQRQRFLPYIHSVAWVRDLIAEDSTSSRAKMLQPLAALDENWLKQARFSPQMPTHWCGYWNSTMKTALDVFPRNVFYKSQLYRVLGVFEQQDLVVFQIGTVSHTKFLALKRTPKIDDSLPGLAFELAEEKFKEPIVNELYKRDRNPRYKVPQQLYGDYLEQKKGSFKKPILLARVEEHTIVALKRRWRIQSHEAVFGHDHLTYRFYAQEEKSGMPGYFVFENDQLYSNTWNLRLNLEDANIASLPSLFDLGTNKELFNIRKIPYNWIFFTALMALLMYGLYRRRLYNLQRAQSRTQLALTGLRAQLNPHFLFNALTSIQDLVNQDNKPAANRYFNEMAELLRYVVDSSKEEYTPLAAELEALEKYCSLESLRTPFGYSFDVRPELNQHTTEIPTLLIQPFIENAILHGLRPSTEAKELKVSIWPEGDNRIGVSILDNGIGIEEAQRRQDLIGDLRGHQGMATTQQRIDLLNEGKREKITLKVVDRSRLKPNLIGTLVQLSIPI